MSEETKISIEYDRDWIDANVGGHIYHTMALLRESVGNLGNHIEAISAKAEGQQSDPTMVQLKVSMHLSKLPIEERLSFSFHVSWKRATNTQSQSLEFIERCKLRIDSHIIERLNACNEAVRVLTALSKDCAPRRSW